MLSRRRRRRSIVGITLALVATLSVASSTLATFPGRNGPITFMREDANGHWQTWTARSDLSHARQLTAIPGRDSGWSVWSPDGERIAFDSNRADPDPDADPFINDIFTMKADGSDVRKLTDSVGYAGGAPAYSPNGKLIAFEADRGDFPAQAGIYVMNAKDGSHLRRITTLPVDGDWDGAPKFSPDGKKLLFTRFRNDWNQSAIHVVRLDGSGLRRVTPWDLTAGDGDWSPDGKHIVFELDRWLDARGDAFIVGSDGTGLRNLTFQPAVPGVWEAFADPVFSPDGKQILVLHGIFLEDGTSTSGLATIRPDGSHLEYVSDGLGIEHQPDWGRAPRH